MKPITPKTIEKAEKLAKLMVKHINGTLTPVEDCELGSWIGGHPDRIKLFEEITNPDKIKEALKMIYS